MILFKKAAQLSAYLDAARQRGQTIGLVPTMGALHNGHTALLQACKKETDVTVCSIFVNPTQFNNPTDYKHYPNTIEQDIETLMLSGCDVLFLPARDEIYPQDYTAPHYHLGKIETMLEGAYRPGHFQGVCQAVDRLLLIATPHAVFFGQKDYQQCMVIRKLLTLTNREHIGLHIIPTQREESGLALSSRNLRLTPEQRKQAVALYDTLTFLKTHIEEKNMTDLEKEGMGFLKSCGFSVDYVCIADAETLHPAKGAKNTKLVALVAAALGDVRLIDNMLLN